MFAAEGQCRRGVIILLAIAKAIKLEVKGEYEAPTPQPDVPSHSSPMSNRPFPQGERQIHCPKPFETCVLAQEQFCKQNGVS